MNTICGNVKNKYGNFLTELDAYKLKFYVFKLYKFVNEILLINDYDHFIV